MVKSSYDFENLWGPVKPRDPSWPLDPLRPDPLVGFQNKKSRLCLLRATRRSSLQSLFCTDFLYSLFASRYSLFATFSLRLTARYTLLPFYYSLIFTRSSRLASLFFLLAALLLFLLARRSPLSSCYTLLDACCSFFLNSLVKLVTRWLLYANRGLLPADHFWKRSAILHYCLLPSSSIW